METYSLEGEDLVLDRYFSGKNNGFYIDIGAYHPTLYSNTYKFYLRGWSGINIDATPGSMVAFDKIRPHDINLEMAASPDIAPKKLFCFEEPALNSFDESVSRDRERRGYNITRSVEVKVHALVDILDKHVPCGTNIDFLSIDTEGNEIDILKSNNWKKYKPEIILVEYNLIGKTEITTLKQAMDSDLIQYLQSVGYQPIAKTIDNVILKRCDAGYDADFLDKGFWTPQTAMLRNIYRWVNNNNYECKTCLSIDKNPTLEPIVLGRWPNASIEYAIYPEADACNLTKIQSNRYDLVFSHQILEHIQKPWVAAKEMTRVLKHGGIGIHTTCAFNPRHGEPAFGDYYRFLKDGLAALFDDVKILCLDEWGNREAILYNVGIDDGNGALGGRRFHELIGSNNDGLYPWHTWIIFEKN